MFSEFDGAGHVVSEPVGAVDARDRLALPEIQDEARRRRTRRCVASNSEGDAPLALNLSANLMSHLLRSLWGFSVSGSMASSTSLLCQSMHGIVPRSAICESTPSRSRVSAPSWRSSSAASSPRMASACSADPRPDHRSSSRKLAEIATIGFSGMCRSRRRWWPGDDMCMVGSRGVGQPAVRDQIAHCLSVERGASRQPDKGVRACLKPVSKASTAALDAAHRRCHHVDVTHRSPHLRRGGPRAPSTAPGGCI